MSDPLVSDLREAARLLEERARRFRRAADSLERAERVCRYLDPDEPLPRGPVLFPFSRSGRA